MRSEIKVEIEIDDSQTLKVSKCTKLIHLEFLDHGELSYHAIFPESEADEMIEVFTKAIQFIAATPPGI
jgi:hypothetical protein